MSFLCVLMNIRNVGNNAGSYLTRLSFTYIQWISALLPIKLLYSRDFVLAIFPMLKNKQRISSWLYLTGSHLVLIMYFVRIRLIAHFRLNFFETWYAGCLYEDLELYSFWTKSAEEGAGWKSRRFKNFWKMKAWLPILLKLNKSIICDGK